jgi:hypothetical protein
MADTETLREAIKTPAPFGSWLGVVLLFALFGAIVLAVIGPAPRGDNYEQKRAQEREKKLKDLRDADTQALSSYAWIDKNKGVARIPIERAMQLTLADLAKKKPAAAYPIATPEAAASPAGSAAASPAPAASAQPSGTPKSESHAQPAAAANPPATQPATQPGASATPAASPQSSAAVPAVSSSPAKIATPPGSPLPVRGASPSSGQ